MKSEMAKKAADLGGSLAEIGTEIRSEAVHIKDRLAGSLEEGAARARQTMKRTRNSAEEMLDSATYEVKRHPLESVGIVFSIGLTVGVAIGWLAGRKEK